MNEILFLIINSWAGQAYWLDRLMIFFAEWLGYFLILFLFIPLFLTYFVRSNWISSKLRYALLELTYYKDMLLVSVGSAIMARFIFVQIIRFLYHSPRPFTVLSEAIQLVTHETTPSFPSGHATFYFALATGVYLYNKKIGIWYLVSAGLISFARVFVGVHWPLDVVAGAVLGVATAVTIQTLKEKIPLKGLFRN